MDSTKDFVAKVQDTQRKAERNKKRNGEGLPANQLSNKQHSTNK